MSETQSKESILEDPLDQTLDDTDQDWDDVLKPQNQKKRGKAITYELYQPFQEYDQIVKQIKEGNINGNNWIFKNKDGDKYRYYCKFNKLSYNCNCVSSQIGQFQ